MSSADKTAKLYYGPSSFRVLRQEAERARLPVAGRPLTLFLETDDNGFRYEAMLPVGPAPFCKLDIP